MQGRTTRVSIVTDMPTGWTSRPLKTPFNPIFKERVVIQVVSSLHSLPQKDYIAEGYIIIWYLVYSAFT